MHRIWSARQRRTLLLAVLAATCCLAFTGSAAASQTTAPTVSQNVWGGSAHVPGFRLTPRQVIAIAQTSPKVQRELRTHPGLTRRRLLAHRPGLRGHVAGHVDQELRSPLPPVRQDRDVRPDHVGVRQGRHRPDPLGLDRACGPDRPGARRPELRRLRAQRLLRLDSTVPAVPGPVRRSAPAIPAAAPGSARAARLQRLPVLLRARERRRLGSARVPGARIPAGAHAATRASGRGAARSPWSRGFAVDGC